MGSQQCTWGEDRIDCFLPLAYDLVPFCLKEKVISVTTSQIHQGERCYSGLVGEEVPGSSRKMWIAGKLIEKYQELLVFSFFFSFFFAFFASGICSFISLHSVTLQTSAPAELGREDTEMSLNHMKEFL